MATKPISAQVQDLIHSMDVGLGQQVVKVVLYALFVLMVMFLFTGTQFHGLDNEEAMDAAQLGRNLAMHGTFQTQVVRPSTLRLLMDRSATLTPSVHEHPDLLQPPVYPVYLALLFRILQPDFEPEAAQLRVYGPDKVVVWGGGHLFTALTGLVLFLLGSRLFDRRIGVLGATIYFLSNTVWTNSISGTSLPMAGFFVSAAILAALWAADRRDKGASKASWIGLLLLSALLTLLAGLTRYGALALAPGLALYILFAFRKGWQWAALYLLIVAIGMVPWIMRNHAVSGTLLGLAPRTVVEQSRNYPGDSFHRTLVPGDEPADKTARVLHAKSLGNLRNFYQNNLRTVGDGFLISLFFATFLYRFVRRHVHLLRWGLAVSMLMTLYGASFFGSQSIVLLHLYWPLVILYGLAFFFLLLDRLQLPLAIYRQAITMLLIVFSTLPLILAFTPPRRGFPYPPYAAQMIINISRLLEPDELMCSDIPWATAWYGNRTSLLLPRDVEEFYQVNDTLERISGLYFTTVTRNQPYVRNLRTGRDKDWFQIMEGRMMADFPLTHGFPIFNFDQMFLTDRDRRAQP